MPDILSKQNGAILEVTLNRPDRGNGADDAMAIEITRLIEDTPEDGLHRAARGRSGLLRGRVARGTAADRARQRVRGPAILRVCVQMLWRDPCSPIRSSAVVQARALGFGCVQRSPISRSRATRPPSGSEMAHNIPTMVMSSFVDASAQDVHLSGLLDRNHQRRALNFGIVATWCQPRNSRTRWRR
jgi:hypothetical protein